MPGRPRLVPTRRAPPTPDRSTSEQPGPAGTLAFVTALSGALLLPGLALPLALSLLLVGLLAGVPFAALRAWLAFERSSLAVSTVRTRRPVVTRDVN